MYLNPKYMKIKYMENMKKCVSRRGTHTAPKHGETDYRGDAREREIYVVHFVLL